MAKLGHGVGEIGEEQLTRWVFFFIIFQLVLNLGFDRVMGILTGFGVG